MGKDDFFNPINFGNQEYIEHLLEQYQRDPTAITGDWGAFFQGVEFVSSSKPTISAPSQARTDSNAPSDLRIRALIDSYRKYGHLLADINPMTLPPVEVKELSLSTLGFEMSDLAKSFPTCGLCSDPVLTLEAIIHKLRSLYCQKISFESNNHGNRDFEEWFYSMIETFSEDFDSDMYRHLLLKLFKAKEFEAFLQKRFLGAKRFSLEGGESFIPLMSELINLAAKNGCKTMYIGMAHRGRLNTLCNLLKKPYSLLFHEFSSDSLPAESEGLGDVKYHKGYCQEVTTRENHKIKLTLAPNPSHLEAVDPVVLGMAHAKQKIADNVDAALPILIHGDASISGQGIVYEVMQFYKIKGYSVGGSIHIVINNQIGFTAEPEETRSTMYCTDIAKTFSSPVIHVNADDPIACMKAAIIAFEVRQKFHIDVFIDLNCHRLYGHNEADEPRFTNPRLYKAIKEKDHVYKVFSAKTIEKGIVTNEEVVQMEKKFQEELAQALDDATRFTQEEKPKIEGIASRLEIKAALETFEQIETKISHEKVLKLTQKITQIPDDFIAHAKIRKLFEGRRNDLMNDAGKPVVDWASAELLAYASLVEKGIHVRISGEDSKRGTFSHRHATIVDQESNDSYTPLCNVSENQAPFDVYSSPLSEYGVMGFDYGYSIAYPTALVVWEGQFGDFVNGAQIIIDQFFSSSETKWGRVSGLTLFLPHGFEGMGPEHSSCRIERFLQLSALDNMRVVIPSTPAQLFHLLRRQVMTTKKKPLVVVMPKSMLRLTSSFSTVKDITDGEFQFVIHDTKGARKVRKLIICSGKIYHELAQRRDEIQADDIAIVRIEQIFPLHKEVLLEAIEPFKGAKQICFVQEEPRNQGTWEYLSPHLKEMFKDREVQYIGRPRSSIPDTGFHALFKVQQEQIIIDAIGEKKE